MDESKDVCMLCCWDYASIIFNDEDYARPPINSELYNIQLLTGYNWVINPNSFNKCTVCNECLIDKIYECNINQKTYILEDLLIYHTTREVLNCRLPKELVNIVYSYII
jgi:hypothetical protein